jgi:hypothetical protein
MRTEGTNSPPPDGGAGDLAPGAPRDATYGPPSPNGPPPLADVAHPDDGPYVADPYVADPYDTDPYDTDPYEVARPAAPAGALPGDVTRYFVDFLSRATALLGATLDQEAMLRGLARASVPVIGDWCFVDLVQPDGDLGRIAVAHAAAEDARLASPLSAAPPAHGPDSP